MAVKNDVENLCSFVQDSSTIAVFVLAENAVFLYCCFRRNHRYCFLFHGIEEE